MELVERAAHLAEELLRPLGRRWQHTRCVARAAAVLPLPAEAAETVTASAWLHDIGYATPLVDTGLHALDGARHLQREDWPNSVVSLVAHHSGAHIEAQERGLADQLAAFSVPDPLLLECLIFADMTSGPDGERVSVTRRLSEILDRYPDDSPVHRAITRSRPTLTAAVQRTIERFQLPNDGF